MQEHFPAGTWIMVQPLDLSFFRDEFVERWAIDWMGREPSYDYGVLMEGF